MKLYFLSIGINIALVSGMLFYALVPAISDLENDCDYGEEFLKIKAQYGVRYYDLSSEQRNAFDEDFNEMTQVHTTLGSSQEEIDEAYYALLHDYGMIESSYSDQEIKSLFYDWIKICQDY